MGTFDQIFHAYISKPQEKFLFLQTSNCSSSIKLQWRLLTRFVMTIFQNFLCTFAGLNDAVVSQNWQISGMNLSTMGTTLTRTSSCCQLAVICHQVTVKLFVKCQQAVTKPSEHLKAWMGLCDAKIFTKQSRHLHHGVLLSSHLHQPE